MIFSRRLTCAFCGKEAIVARSVAKARLHICDECAAIAAQLMHDEPAADVPTLRRPEPVMKRVKDLWWHLLMRIRLRKIQQASFISERIDDISGRVHGPSSEGQHLPTG